MITIKEKYRSRSIEFIEIYKVDEWRFKLYGISYTNEPLEIKLLNIAKGIALDNCPKKISDNYGVGFIGVHKGRNSNFIFLDWWANENELYHKVFISNFRRLYSFNEKTHTGIKACVWDLELIEFERNAWIKHVLNEMEPSLLKYLDCRLTKIVDEK